MIHIKILGPGCDNCSKVEAAAEAAVAALGIEATIEKVTDREVFAHYRLLATPGLVINDRLVAGGRIPSQAEIITLIGRAQAALSA